MSDTVNNSLPIILDNIKVLGLINRLDTYRKISQFTSIPLATIGSWYACKHKKPTYPKLSTLDRLCDSFNIHTSELFIPESKFQNTYVGPNDSMKCFRTNLNRICIEKTFVRPKDRINLLCNWEESGREHYYSYLRKKDGKIIPIHELDRYANLLDIQSYELLLPLTEDTE